MRLRGRLLAALLLLPLTLPFYALAEQPGWERAYGGRGEDELTELISVGDGLFAVGRTFSSDGDLSSRTRAGETGWALRLDAEGGVLWSLSTAHAGRARLSAPYAHADGSLSAVLSGEERGSEWLRISAQGRVTARVELRERETGCAHDEDAALAMLGAADVGGAPAMILCAMHADGSRCFSLMDESGAVRQGDETLEDVPGGALWRTGSGGRVVRAGVREGGADIALVTAGSEDAARVLVVPVAGGLSALLDALVCEDGSVIVSGRVAGGSVLLRVSAEGETIFSIHPDGAAERLALTRSGFAAATQRAVLFFDEEGAPLGEMPLTAEPAQEQVLSLCAFGGGAATLRHIEGSKLRQAVVFACGEYDKPAQSAAEGALYARADSRLLGAKTASGGVLLLVQDGDGQVSALTVDAEGRAQESAYDPQWLQGVRELTPAKASGQTAQGELPAAQSGLQALASGALGWEAIPGGALVTRRGADNGVLWQTRVPIRTAADRVELRFAAELAGGDILVGGCYATGEGSVGRESVLFYLGKEGALRAFYTLPDADMFCAARMWGDALVLLAAQDMGYKTEVTEAVVFAPVSPTGQGYSVAARVRLSVPLEAQDVFLLPGAQGEAYAAGTSVRNGLLSAVLERVNVDL